MNRFVIKTLMFLGVLSLGEIILLGQETAQPDTTAAVILAIPTTDITVQATQVNSILLDKQNNLLSEDQKAAIDTRRDTLLFKLSLLREDPRIHRTEALNFRNLEYLVSQWSIMSSRLETEQKSLTNVLQGLESHRIELEKLIIQWELTRESARQSGAPGSVLEQVSATLSAVSGMHQLYMEDSDFLQEALVEIASGLIFSNETLGQVRLALNNAAKNLLTLNRPPFWKEFSTQEGVKVIREQRSYVEDTITGLKDFYENYKLRVWLHLFLSIVIIVLVYVTFNNLKHAIPDEDIPQIESLRHITNRPFASGLLLSLLLTIVFYQNRHEAVGLILAVALMIPVVSIFKAIITGQARRYVYMVVGAMVLVQLHRLAYHETLFNRTLLLVIILYGIIMVVMILARKSQRKMILSSRFGGFLFSLGILALLILIISLVSVIVGGVLLAEFLTHPTIESAGLALIFYTLALILNSIIVIALYSKRFQKSNLITKNREQIYARFAWIINLLSILFWLVFTFRGFGIWDEVSGWILRVLTNSINIGKVEFSLGNLILFFFIIWLTLWISRMVRIVFEGEATIRGKLKRGVPAAISLVIRITLITIGFLLAIAAAGMEMSKLTILLGAFGVGIGFGLQNIFNNLVSGIILAFERPINEGDIIEVGVFLGTVKQIGIRASTIRTFDGAEVVVPNGNLISNELINWTLSDSKRRVEVTIGVKYGTDPRKVLEILKNIAGEHEEVLDNPEPVTLFSAHGESSLDFRLLCWIPDADHRLRVASDLTVQVSDELKKAGIEIPFPQRDLHLRSVEGKVMDRVRAVDEKSKKPSPPKDTNKSQS